MKSGIKLAKITELRTPDSLFYVGELLTPPSPGHIAFGVKVKDGQFYYLHCDRQSAQTVARDILRYLEATA